MKRKIIVAAAAATLALFIMVIALPAFTAPAMAVSVPIVDGDQSEQSIESLTLSDALLYLGDRGFNSSNDFTLWQFTHMIQENTKFALDFAKLIEFDDSDGDQMYTAGIDTPIANYNLRTDISWDPSSIQVTQTADSIQISITGTCTDLDNNFKIEISATIYFTAETVEFSGNQVTIPADIALKFGLDITGYQWHEGASSSRYLALVIVLHSCLEDSLQYRYRWANGNVVANGDSGLVPSIVNDGSVSEVYFVDDAGNPVALFNWFNGAYNGTCDCVCNSSFCLVNETMTISIAFPYDDFQSGDIYIDPYFQMLDLEAQQNHLSLILAFYALSQFYASQTTSTMLIFGGIAAAVVLIGIAAVLIRRK